MDQNLFPPRAGDISFADRMPRMDSPHDRDFPKGDRPHEDTRRNGGYGCGSETARDGGCGCGSETARDGGCGCGSETARDGGCVGHEGCGDNSWGLSEYPLAMVYAPCQQFRALYDPATALSRGTLFTELDLPLGGDCGFTATGCACRAERRRV